MRALVIADGALALRERPAPEPGPTDVIVSVRRAGINAADLLQRRGLYPAPPGWPDDVPGLEIAGVVSAVGDRVHEPLLGRRVCAIVGGGAQADEALVPSEHLYFIPDHIDWDRAGGFAEAYTTAHDALVTQGALTPGARVLVSGASGGVGSATVQLAHALGATVVASTRDAAHHERLRALGADETMTTDELGALEPVDVIVELVGAAHLNAALGRLRPHGRAVVVGVGAGSRAEVDLVAVMSRRLHLTGSTLRSRSREEKTAAIDLVAHGVVPRWHTGEVDVLVDRVFDLEEAAEAYEYFARPGKLGKVVLRLDD